MAELPGIDEVYDLHVWGLSTTETALTAHLLMPELSRPDAFLLEASKRLADRFGIRHATLQIEQGSTIACPHASRDIV